MLRKQILLVVAVGLLQGWCFGDTHYVSPTGSKTPPYDSWTKAAQTIRPAVKAATAGDTVLVAAGTYLINTQVNLTKGITLKSANGSEATIIDGVSANTRCLYISHPQAVVDGFTIRNGTVSGDNGGGVKIKNAGVLQNCTISNNLSHLGGGGICCENGGQVKNCIVTCNVCDDFGGGVYCFGGGKVFDSLVSSNRAFGGMGGGMFLRGTAALARYCRISDNRATQCGGGAYVTEGAVLETSRLDKNEAGEGGGVYGSETGLLRKCHLSFNQAKKIVQYPGCGGGAYLTGNFVMKNCGVFMNSADNFAGGVVLTNSTMLRHSVIAVNYAQKRAGGVYCSGDSYVYNCTIIENQVLQKFLGLGGGVYCNSGGNVWNSIIYSNKAVFSPNWHDEGSGGWYSSCCTEPLPVNDAYGCFTDNPHFAHTDVGLSWMRSEDSPGEDGVDFEMSDKDGDVDYMARSRDIGGMDVGAIEFGRVVNDYKWTGCSAMTVYSQSAGEMTWYAATWDNINTLWNVKWGFDGCVPVPGDYNADGYSDLAVFHAASGKWYIYSWIAGGEVLASGTPWGFAGCIPVPGDYDQDGKDDLAVYYPAGGSWYILSSTGTILAWGVKWGFSGCTPVPGDYNGDGRADMALYHAATGKWYIRTTSEELASGLSWGFKGCVPVPGDYDSDGLADLNVFDTATGKWYVRSMIGNVLLNGFPWGFAGCTPMMGDFNGGGKTDLAVYHQPTGKWYIAQPFSGKVIAWGKAWGGSAMPAVKP